MNELKEILLEQLQLLQKYSKSGYCLPSELTDLSNAMANIAKVVDRITEKGAACTSITTGKLADIGTTADKLAFDGAINLTE